MTEQLNLDDLTDDEKREVFAAHQDALANIQSKRNQAAHDAQQATLRERYDQELAKIMQMNVTGLRRVDHIAELRLKYRRMGLEIH